MIKNVSYYAIISVITGLLNLLATLMLSRLLLPEEYAYLGLFAVFIYLLNPIMSFNTIGLVGINIVNYNKNKYEYFTNVYITYLLGSSFLVLAILSVSLIIIEPYRKLIMLSYFVATINLFVTIHYAELIQTKKICIFGIYKILYGILNILAIKVFIDIMDLSWSGRLLGIIISGIIVLVVMYKKSFDTLRRYKFIVDYKEVKSFLLYGYPLLLGLGAAWLTTQLDKFIVLYYYDMSILGYYSFGYTIGMSFMVINQSLVNAIVPKIFSILKNGVGLSIISKYSAYYNIFIITIVSIGITIMYYFSDLILGEKYSKSLYIIILVMVGMAFDGMYRIYGLIIIYYKENKLRTKIEYSIVIINILFSIMLIPQIGVYAPAIGTIISHLLGFILSMYYSKKIMNINGVI